MGRRGSKEESHSNRQREKRKREIVKKVMQDAESIRRKGKDRVATKKIERRESLEDMIKRRATYPKLRLNTLTM